jgi:Kef-type K+ transport system membrane component KefB
MRALAFAVLANVIFASALAAMRPMEISARGRMTIFLSDALANAAGLVAATLVIAAIGWALMRFMRLPRLVAYLIGGILVGAAVVTITSYALLDVEDVTRQSVIGQALLVVPIGAGLGLVLWLCAWMASNNALERKHGR